MPFGGGVLGGWLYGDQRIAPAAGAATPAPPAPAPHYLVDLELTGGTEYISTDDLNDIIIGPEVRQYKRRLIDISSLVESLPTNDFGVSKLSDINLKLSNNTGYFSALYNVSDWRNRPVRIRRWDGYQVTGIWHGVITDANMIDEATVTIRFYDPSDLQTMIPRCTVNALDWTPVVSIVATAGGILPAGSYWYTVFAYGIDGSILGRSEEVGVALSGASGSATLSWTLVDAAAFYRVVGRDAIATGYGDIAAGTLTAIDDGTGGTLSTIGTTPNFQRAIVDLGKAYAICIGDHAYDVPMRCVNEDFDNNRYDYLCYDTTAAGYLHAVKRNGVLVDPTEYTAYNGTDSPYPGFLLIRFALQQTDFSSPGNYYDITIDASRAVDASGSYGFIQNIAFLLSHPTIGGGKTINTDSFTIAATIPRMTMLTCAAVLDTQITLQSIVDDMLWCVGGYLDTNSNGEYVIVIDQPVSGTSMSFDVKGEMNRHRILDITERKKTSLVDAVNTIALEFCKRKSWTNGSGASESYALKTTARAVHGNGKDEIHQSDFVNDPTVADRIICYWALRRWVGDESLTLSCDKAALVLKRYQTINFVDAVHGIDDTYQIESVSGDIDKVELTCIHLDDSIYVYTPMVPPASPPVVLIKPSPSAYHGDFVPCPINVNVTNPPVLRPGDYQFYTFTIPSGKGYTIFSLQISAVNQAGNSQLFLMKGEATASVKIKKNYDWLMANGVIGGSYYNDNGDGTYSWGKRMGDASDGYTLSMAQIPATPNGFNIVDDVSGIWYVVINNSSPRDFTQFTGFISVS